VGCRVAVSWHADLRDGEPAGTICTALISSWITRFTGQLHEHDGLSVPSPRRIWLRTATAQPTPDETWIAASGQFIRQAPHSMHVSRLITLAT
jgi:hypothetical protein